MNSACSSFWQSATLLTCPQGNSFPHPPVCPPLTLLQEPLLCLATSSWPVMLRATVGSLTEKPFIGSEPRQHNITHWKGRNQDEEVGQKITGIVEEGAAISSWGRGRESGEEARRRKTWGKWALDLHSEAASFPQRGTEYSSCHFSSVEIFRVLKKIYMTFSTTKGCFIEEIQSVGVLRWCPFHVLVVQKHSEQDR